MSGNIQSKLANDFISIAELTNKSLERDVILAKLQIKALRKDIKISQLKIQINTMNTNNIKAISHLMN